SVGIYTTPVPASTKDISCRSNFLAWKKISEVDCAKVMSIRLDPLNTAADRLAFNNIVYIVGNTVNGSRTGYTTPSPLSSLLRVDAAIMSTSMNSKRAAKRNLPTRTHCAFLGSVNQ